MGVWIETSPKVRYQLRPKSHPAWVCGLKHYRIIIEVLLIGVTPCVGVWIETLDGLGNYSERVSHPAWVCGLKPIDTEITLSLFCHTLRGCVD